MEKDFEKRIEYFERFKQLIIYRLNDILGEENTKNLLSALYEDSDLSIYERNELYDNLLRKYDTQFVSKTEYIAGTTFHKPIEYSSTIESLLKKYDSYNMNIKNLKQGKWVEIQEDYLPSKKEYKKDVQKIKDQQFEKLINNNEETNDICF